MLLRTFTLLNVLLLCGAPTHGAEDLQNPAVDYPGFQDMTQAARAHRESRLISEAEFLRLASAPGTVVLDTRSAGQFASLHVAGAVHLEFSDITRESLEAVIGPRDTRVLIYCNNNFTGPLQAFPRKMAVAALNIPTFVTLYSYGYRNVYELAPLIEPASSRLVFEGHAINGLGPQTLH